MKNVYRRSKQEYKLEKYKCYKKTEVANKKRKGKIRQCAEKAISYLDRFNKKSYSKSCP